MKKLLILAAILVAGVAANAASFKWSAANIYASNGTDKFSGTATLYAYAATETVADAIVAFSAPVTSGAISTTAGAFSNDALIGGTAYNFFFTIEDGGKTFTSTTKENVLAQATSAVNIAFGNMQSATQNASNWAAVPEPTSGLLLLLGMAGLALKRKRA